MEEETSRRPKLQVSTSGLEGHSIALSRAPSFMVRVSYIQKSVSLKGVGYEFRVSGFGRGGRPLQLILLTTT